MCIRVCNSLYRSLRLCLQSSLAVSAALLITACTGPASNERTAATAAAIAQPVATSEAAPSSVAGPAEIPAEAQRQFDQALASLKAGQTEPAKQLLQQLTTAYPNFAGPVINLGLIELKANRYEAAVELFKRALQRDAKSVAANNYLGVSYRYLGRFKDAEAAYKAAIAVDDSYAAAHLNLGVLYDLYLQQPELALPEYQRYQELLNSPDAKVTSWIKELSSRLSAEQKARANANGAQP